MAKVAREIFISDPDPVEMLDELFYRTVRGPTGLPLGNVARHAQDRRVKSYTALVLVSRLVREGYLTSPDTLEVVAIGATHQDKSAGGEFQAAHALPTDFVLGSGPALSAASVDDLKSGAVGTQVPRVFRNQTTREQIQRDIFGYTNRVHWLTNFIDSTCERLGNRQALVDCVELVLRAEARNQTLQRKVEPLEIYRNDLARRYRESARAALEYLSGRVAERLGYRPGSTVGGRIYVASKFGTTMQDPTNLQSPVRLLDARGRPYFFDRHRNRSRKRFYEFSHRLLEANWSVAQTITQASESHRVKLSKVARYQSRTARICPCNAPPPNRA